MRAHQDVQRRNQRQQHHGPDQGPQQGDPALAVYHPQLIDEQRQQRASHRPPLVGAPGVIAAMQDVHAVPQDRKVAGLVPGQLDFQRDIVAGRMAPRLARLVLLSPFDAARMRRGQALVLGHELGRHVSRLEYLGVRADVLLKQPHDQAQAPPREIGKRLVDPAARDLRVQLRLHGLVHRPAGGHGVVRLALKARHQRLEQHGRRGLFLEQLGRIQPPGGDAGSHRVVALFPARAPALDPVLVAHRHAIAIRRTNWSPNRCR
ncbi:hypothetical protein D3C71_1387300 [compost metagenome]